MIEPRSAWNARQPRSTTPRPLSHFRGIRVHHSGGSGSASVRAIQDWDMDQKGLVDIGYSYIIRDGRVFEGRGTNHPAHDSINDTFGVCIIGTYTSTLPSSADLDALVACIRELRAMTGRKLPVDGHRDVAQTACPGGALYAHLSTIIERAEQEDDMATPQEIWGHRIPPEASIADSYPGIRDDGFRASTWVQYGYRWSRRAADRINEARADLAAVRAEIEQLPGAIAEAVGVELTDEQIHAIADRVAAVGEAKAAEVLARLTEAGRVLAAEAHDE